MEVLGVNQQEILLFVLKASRGKAHRQVPWKPAKMRPRGPNAYARSLFALEKRGLAVRHKVSPGLGAPVDSVELTDEGLELAKRLAGLPKEDRSIGI